MKICTKNKIMAVRNPEFFKQADHYQKSLLCLHKAYRKARPIRPLMNCASYAAA